MNTPIPIIDIFAGPGGLGEGFSSFRSEKGEQLFKIKLSIEKDEFAHRTLELRAFYRQFVGKTTPFEYYEYLRGNIKRDDLFKKYEAEALNAKNEAWQATLGETKDDEVDSRISTALGGASNWVLIGGPPCQAYSLIGRAKIRGEDKKKEAGERTYENDLRHFLYKEYLRILAVYKPPVFVMENVKGLLSAEVKQQKTFDRILSDLESPKIAIGDTSEPALFYRLFSISKKRSKKADKTNPRDYIVRSEEYGIPQSRHRIIILGVRSDIFKSDPEILPKNKRVSINDVIGDLPKLRGGLSKQPDSPKEWRRAIMAIACSKWLESVQLPLRDLILRDLKKVRGNLTRGKPFLPMEVSLKKYREWYIDPNLGGVCNHESRGHIQSDLHRYFFAAVFARQNHRSPYLNDFPRELLPNHKNALDGSKFNDRFRVQLRGKPSTTVVSHISQDGHYYIHYDSFQCRSLTVREAARLQTFPDNYFFEGTKTQQYHQVGNAVPPMLANQIAKIVAGVLKDSK